MYKAVGLMLQIDKYIHLQFISIYILFSTDYLVILGQHNRNGDEGDPTEYAISQVIRVLVFTALVCMLQCFCISNKKKS